MSHNPNDFFDSSTEEGQLAVDVIETRDIIIIRSAIAGVSPERLQIHTTNDVVTIRGEREIPPLQDDATVHFHECFWGPFSRSVILPHHVNPEGAVAEFEHGILTLTLPKLRGEMQVKIHSY